MLLLFMMQWCMMWMSNPHFTVTDKVGEYVEIINPQYDAKANQTYAVVVVYEIDATGQAPYLRWMQPRPFAGKPTQQEMLKTIVADSYVNIVGLK